MNEPIEFESSEVVNDLPVEQGGLKPIPEGAIAAEQVTETPATEAAADGDAPDPDETIRDDRGRFQRGRRAPSHEARPDDAPRIAKLSADLRETRVRVALAEGLRDPDEILKDIYPQATDAERAKQRDKVIAQIANYKPRTTAVKHEPAIPVALPPVTADTFSEPEPKLEEFASEPDPYQAHLRALGKWDARKEAFDKTQSEKTAARTAAEAKQKEDMAAIGQKWQARVAQAKTDDPTWETTIAPVDAQIPGQSVLAYAILLDEDGPKMLKFLASQQELLDELILAHPPVTDATIAAMRRRLHSRMQGGKTGAPTPTTPITPLSRPPTPVRTLTTVPSDDAADPNDPDAHFERRRLERRRAAR